MVPRLRLATANGISQVRYSGMGQWRENHSILLFISDVAGHRPSARGIECWGGLCLLVERKFSFVMVDLPDKFYPENELCRP